MKILDELYEWANDQSQYTLIPELFKNALFFNTATAAGIANIKIRRDTNSGSKYTIPNYFGISFAQQGCVDCDTEFLTPNGWKKISDYKDGDLVLSWSENKETEFLKPNHYIKLPETELNHYKTRDIDIKICNEHNMALYDKNERYVEMKANKLLSIHSLSRYGAEYSLPFNFNSPNSKGIDISDNMLRLQVAYIADGYEYHKGYDNCRIRVKKNHKKNRLHYLLKKSGIKYKSYSTKSEPEYERFVFKPWSKHKSYNSFWMCSDRQLSIIYDEVSRWDGTINENGTRVFRTTKKDEADFIQYVFSTQQDNQVKLKFSERYDKNPFHTEYVVSTTKTKKINFYSTKSRLKKQWNKIKTKDGFKYCFNMPSGKWIARSNNNIYCYLNCGKDHSFNLASYLYKEVFRKYTEYSSQFYNSHYDSKNDKGDIRYVNISSPYIPVNSSWQGIQKTAQTVSDQNFGSVSIISDELADDITGMSETLSMMKTGWDSGISRGPVNVTDGGKGYFEAKDVPFNSLLFGAPEPFNLVPKKKEKLLEYYLSGGVRRSFILHIKDYKKSQNRNTSFETLPIEKYETIDEYKKQLRDFLNSTTDIVMPNDVYAALTEYNIEQEGKRESLNSDIAENLGAPKKIEKLMGILAILDLSNEITLEHMRTAIQFTEALDATVIETVEIKPIYMQIYEELTRRSFAARTDIIKAVKDVTVRTLENEMILVKEHASMKGNSLIQKEADGIIRYRVEKLSESSLDKVTLSVCKNMNKYDPSGFIKAEGKFENLYKIVNSECKYSAGTFKGQYVEVDEGRGPEQVWKDGYITDANYQKDQCLFIVDVDDGLTIEDAKGLFSNYTYLITTTKSHQKEKNGIVCDRFRLILPTISAFHLEPEVYKDMYMNVLGALGIDEADSKCRNSSRWYYGNPDGEHYYNDGSQLLDIRPFIPDSSEKKKADEAISRYEKEDNAPSDIRADGAIRWFLANTSKGNRNDNFFELCMVLKNKIELPDWDSWAERANACLSEPQTQNEVRSTINSASRRHQR